MNRDPRPMAILESAQRQIKSKLGFDSRIEAQEVLLSPNSRYDGIMSVRVGDKKEIPFIFEIKMNMGKLNSRLIDKLAKVRTIGQPILISQSLSEVTRDMLVEKGIGYVDLDGGVYLPIHSNEEGKTSLQLQNRPTLRAKFGESFIKIVFYLISQERARSMTQRELSKLSDLSLGSVNKTLQSLEKSGFIRRRNSREIYITEPKELIIRWTYSYIDGYMESLYRGSFSFTKSPEHTWWKNTPLKGCKWGGEAAAHHYTDGYLKPEQFSIYVSNDKAYNQLISSLRLKKDPQGDLFIFNQFWQDDEQTEHSEFAPPLIAHANLVASTSSRNREAAEILLEILNKEMSSRGKKY